VRKFSIEYKKYQNKEVLLREQLNIVDTKYNNIKRKRYENEKLLIEYELKLQEIKVKSSEEKNDLKKMIAELKEEKEKLDTLFKKDEIKIEQLEKESLNTRKEMNNKLKKLDDNEQKKQNEQTYKKLESLNQLWRHDPSWEDRKNIESLVALKKANLPFTITQGFIAFDKLILNLVKQNNPYFIESQTNLNSNINIIFANELLPKKYKTKFHNIRKARNEWFHAGIYPSIETTDFLIHILNDIDAEVFI